MSLRCEHSIEVSASPEKAFALLDDLPQTPKWLGPCTELVKVSPGPNAVGDKLKYSYSQSGHAGTMDGEIVALIPEKKLVCKYADSMFEVVVDLNIVPTMGGAQLTHVITITPQTFMAKLMSPVISKGLPKQTKDAMDKLKTMLER